NGSSPAGETTTWTCSTQGLSRRCSRCHTVTPSATSTRIFGMPRPSLVPLPAAGITAQTRWSLTSAHSYVEEGHDLVQVPHPGRPGGRGRRVDLQRHQPGADGGGDPVFGVLHGHGVVRVDGPKLAGLPVERRVRFARGHVVSGEHPAEVAVQRAA